MGKKAIKSLVFAIIGVILLVFVISSLVRCKPDNIQKQCEKAIIEMAVPNQEIIFKKSKYLSKKKNVNATMHYCQVIIYTEIEKCEYVVIKKEIKGQKDEFIFYEISRDYGNRLYISG